MPPVIPFPAPPAAPARRWQARNAAMSPRVIVVAIIGMWAFYFLLTTSLAAMGPAEDQIGALWRRLIVTAFGILATLLFTLGLQRWQPDSFVRRVVFAVGAALPLTIVYSLVNTAMFLWWFPTADSLKTIDELQQRSPGHWPYMLMLETTIRWYFFFAAWAVLYVAFSYARQMQLAERRAAQYQLEAQAAHLRALHYQVNPHFLFNTLNSLSALVMRDRRDDAETMIMNLSAFLRTSFAIDPEQMVTLAEEIDLQRLYLAIEQTRFPDRLRVSFDVPEDLETACMPVLILQPVIENAIKYGVAPTSKPIAIRLSASAEHGLLILTVDNDLDQQAPHPGNGTGLGLANVRARLIARYGDAAGCAWGPTDAGGFRASLWLPLVRHGC